MPNLTVLLPVLGIALSETFLFFGFRGYALGAHFLTLLGCLFGSVYVGGESPQLTLHVFALVPLFRLVNLGMPIFFPLTLLWFPFVYAPVIPGVALVATEYELTRPSLRPRLAAVLFVPAVVAGALLAEVEYAIIEPDALIRSLSLLDLGLIAVVMFCFVGFVEELLFRGILQPVLEERIGSLPGLLVASAIFGLMHSAYAVPAEVLFAGGIGLVFGLIYDYTDSLLLITVMHGTLNVFLFGVIPLAGSFGGLV